VLLATAHPAKFGELVARAVGFEPELPARLAACFASPRPSIPIAASVEALRACLLERDA
jgi:threonine synthase